MQESRRSPNYRLMIVTKTGLRPIPRIAAYCTFGCFVTCTIAGIGSWISDLGSSANVEINPTEYLTSAPQYKLAWNGMLAERVIIVIGHDHIMELRSAHFEELIDNWWDNYWATTGVPDRTVDEGMPAQLHDWLKRLQYIETSTIVFGLFAAADRKHVLPNSDTRWLNTKLGYDHECNTLWAMQITDASGWPFRAFETTLKIAPIMEATPHFAAEINGGIPLMDLSNIWSLQSPNINEQSAWSAWRAIPFSPIWHGVILDIMFWGSFIAIINELRRIIRGTRRGRRGLCRACAYPLQGARRCSECGMMPFRAKHRAVQILHRRKA